jgi:hypothetical protein
MQANTQEASILGLTDLPSRVSWFLAKTSVMTTRNGEEMIKPVIICHGMARAHPLVVPNGLFATYHKYMPTGEYVKTESPNFQDCNRSESNQMGSNG